MRDPARILIVDDTPTNVDILAKRLSAHGYEILTAGDGEEGLAVADAVQYDRSWSSGGGSAIHDRKRTLCASDKRHYCFAFPTSETISCGVNVVCDFKNRNHFWTRRFMVNVGIPAKSCRSNRLNANASNDSCWPIPAAQAMKFTRGRPTATSDPNRTSAQCPLRY